MITVESGEVEERRKLVIKLVQAVMTHCSQSLFSQNHSLSYPRLKKPIPNPSDLHLCSLKVGVFLIDFEIANCTILNSHGLLQGSHPEPCTDSLKNQQVVMVMVL